MKNLREGPGNLMDTQTIPKIPGIPGSPGVEDAGDLLAENWEYLAGGAMVLAGGLLVATGVGGPLGVALVSGGVSTIMQKATTGSVNFGDVLLDMVPGGPVVQGLVSGGRAAYSYLSGPGPHTAGGLITRTGVEAGLAALPGPSSSSKAMVRGVGSEVVETGAAKLSREASGDVVASLNRSTSVGSGFAPGKLEYHSATPVLDPGLDLAGMSAHQKGKLGTELSTQALEARGGRVLGSEVTFDVPLEDGALKRVRVDTIAQEADGSVWGIESKFGPSSHFTKNQQAAYPGFSEGQVIPRGMRAQQAIDAGLDEFTVGQHGQGFPIRVDHWLP